MKIRYLLVMAVLPLLAACGASYDFMLVKSSYTAAAQPQVKAQITSTEGYRSLAGQAKTVTIRAPDKCSNTTANNASGAASASASVIASDCGVYMAEIERALTKANYRVISWNILARELARPNVSPIEVAKSLGADILFEINSLEEGEMTLGKDARREYNYYKSDKTAKVGKAWELDETGRATIRTNRALVTRIRQENEKFRPLQVTLDASAVWASTGQSLWYYQWTRADDPKDTAAEFTLLMACMNGELAYCAPVAPETTSSSKKETKAAGESVAESEGLKPEDARRAIYSKLRADIVRDFVTSFAEAQSLAVPIAAPAATN